MSVCATLERLVANTQTQTQTHEKREVHCRRYLLMPASALDRTQCHAMADNSRLSTYCNRAHLMMRSLRCNGAMSHS
jgi:hypothetical protein